MKTRILFLCVLFNAALLTNAYSQKAFEGVIEFDMEISGDGVSAIKAFMPDGYEYYIKGSDLRYKLKGGMSSMMGGDILVKGKEGKTYMLKPDEKIAYLMNPSDKDSNPEDFDPEVEKLDEVMEIAGYKCRKFKITIESPNGPVTQYLWVAEDLRPAKELLEKGKASGQNRLIIKGIDGIPLKMESEMEVPMVGKIKTVMVATKVDKKSLDTDLFTIPGDYTMKNFNAREFGGSFGF